MAARRSPSSRYISAMATEAANRHRGERAAACSDSIASARTPMSRYVRASSNWSDASSTSPPRRTSARISWNTSSSSGAGPGAGSGSVGRPCRSTSRFVRSISIERGAAGAVAAAGAGAGCAGAASEWADCASTCGVTSSGRPPSVSAPSTLMMRSSTSATFDACSTRRRRSMWTGSTGVRATRSSAMTRASSARPSSRYASASCACACSIAAARSPSTQISTSRRRTGTREGAWAANCRRSEAAGSNAPSAASASTAASMYAAASASRPAFSSSS